MTAASQFDRAYEEELESEDETIDAAGPIQRFLETTSLASEVDSLDADSGQVSLMTLHSAKGLEFPVVFVLAVEQNLLPHERALESGELKELEEERRLLFVGMTRAEQTLYLTRTSQREFRGRPLSTITSVFLNEMDLTVTRETESTQSGEGNLDWKELLERTRRRREGGEENTPVIPGNFGLPKLMTGADLLNGTTGGKELPQGFAVGSRVRHPRMGTGTVLKVDGFGHRRTVTVEFEDEHATEETYILSKCPLQPLG